LPLELLENVTAAFLHGMEALTPRQQLLLMLRDVFDYSVRDTASVLEMSEANVKTGLHRARRCLLLRPNTPLTVRQERRTIVRRLLACLRNDDARGVVALLVE
jgi:RNA polymerase sigma-70 factor (ECF subfamily)